MPDNRSEEFKRPTSRMKPVLKWGEECCCQTGKGNPRPQLWGVYWVDYVCPVHGRQQHYDTYDGGTSK